MYRIISGRWKGRKITAPKNFIVRPTTDFAKEALFSILGNRFSFSSISVLDLFAGIGSITFEMASRDCKDITSIDIEPKHCSFINTEAAELGFSLDINIFRADVFLWLKKAKNHDKQYDVIFADPPYSITDGQYESLIAQIFAGNFLKENGLFVLEHQTKRKMEHPQILETRKYGNVSFSLFQSAVQAENQI